MHFSYFHLLANQVKMMFMVLGGLGLFYCILLVYVFFNFEANVSKDEVGILFYAMYKICMRFNS